MTCTEFDRLLDAYLEKALDATRRAELEAHLSGCEACRILTAQMQELLASAATLPRRITPPRNLWPDVASRLASRAATPPSQSTAWRRWAPLAAAAVLLIAVTAVVTARLSRPEAPVAATASPAQPRMEGFAADREYVLAAEDLERVLAEGRGRLAPATVAVLERNLALIDAAIVEARAALEADPANADLRALLWGAHRQKLDLLDWATRLTRS
jgi:hypothetical protein